MLKLKEKIEKIKGYITDIITVIQQYKPNTKCKSTKDLCYVADEMKTAILEASSDIQYMRDVEDSEFYISMQIPMITTTDIFKFYISSPSRTTVTTTEGGTSIYEMLVRTLYIPTKIPTNVENCEGWKAWNCVVRALEHFYVFELRDSKVISIKGNMQGVTIYERNFANNKNLRSVDLRNMESEEAVSMFEDCIRLVSFTNEIVGLKNANRMFYNCTDLRRVKLDFNTIESAEDIFYNCTSLEQIEIEDKTVLKTDLDLSYTALNTTNLFTFLNKLSTTDAVVNIKVSNNLNISDAQKNSYKSKGYNIVQ